jgi:hypothetical protein
VLGGRCAQGEQGLSGRCRRRRSRPARTWTFIEFEIPDDEAERLANGLSEVLDPAHGWYCEFRTSDETFVVFSGRQFRYRRGDRSGRIEVEIYGRSVGVPESQLDWRE